MDLPHNGKFGAVFCLAIDYMLAGIAFQAKSELLAPWGTKVFHNVKFQGLPMNSILVERLRA